jgi:hypothetical protein
VTGKRSSRHLFFRLASSSPTWEFHSGQEDSSLTLIVIYRVLGGEEIETSVAYERRSRPLIERKRLLRSIVPAQPSVMLYAEHIEGYGVEFFRLACERDLEGIVAKAKHAAYSEKWFKIRNPRYSQYEGPAGAV